MASQTCTFRRDKRFWSDEITSSELVFVKLKVRLFNSLLTFDSRSKKVLDHSVSKKMHFRNRTFDSGKRVLSCTGYLLQAERVFSCVFLHEFFSTLCHFLLEASSAADFRLSNLQAPVLLRWTLAGFCGLPPDVCCEQASPVLTQKESTPPILDQLFCAWS